MKDTLILPSAKFGIALLSLLLMALSQVPISWAQPTTSPAQDETIGVQGGRYGIGFASSWPANGISGTLQLSETLTVEAVLGFLGVVTNLSGRGWYRFNRNTNYDLYGYAALGVYRYNYGILSRTETVLGLGAGAGVETGIQALFKDPELPPIFLNAEIGLAYADFKYYSGFSSFVLGGGAHYRFGAR